MSKHFPPESIYALLAVSPEAARGGGIALANESAFNNTFFSHPLTQYATGVLADLPKLTELLDFIAPAVPAPRRFEFRSHNKKDGWVTLENDEDVRALGGEFKRMRSTGELIQSKTLHKGLSALIDGDEIKDDPLVEERKVRNITSMLLRAEILRAYKLLAAAATVSSKTWSAAGGADADSDLLAALDSGGDEAGVNPNRVLFGMSAWQRRVKGLRALASGAGATASALSPQHLSDWLGLDGALIARERCQLGSEKKPLISASAVLCFNALDNATGDDPSNVKRFVTNTDGAGFRVFRREVASDLVEITVSHRSHIVLTSSAGIQLVTVS
jgi:hypothetical protein